MPTARAAAPKATSGKSPKPAVKPMTLAEVMAELEAAGSAQTRKTYARHGVTQAMFGVSFATLKTLYKRIKVDHPLALALWRTDNFDACNLAAKIVDPQRMSIAELDEWASTPTTQMCSSYVACVAAEGLHAERCLDNWLSSGNPTQIGHGWSLLGALAMVDPALDDAAFLPRLAEIEATIHAAANEHREAMNRTLISIGCRSPALRRAALATAKRVGKVIVDHGDTACKTPDAAIEIEKAWQYALSKGFDSPAAQERAREPLRTRC